jgi:hypothetical protein
MEGQRNGMVPFVSDAESHTIQTRPAPAANRTSAFPMKPPKLYTVHALLPSIVIYCGPMFGEIAAAKSV